MGVGSNLDNFGGFAIVDFAAAAAVPDLAKTGLRLRLTYEDEGSTFTDLFAKFIATPGIEMLRALVIGQWSLYQEGDDRRARRGRTADWQQGAIFPSLKRCSSATSRRKKTRSAGLSKRMSRPSGVRFPISLHSAFAAATA